LTAALQGDKGIVLAVESSIDADLNDHGEDGHEPISGAK
jgi:hypothetical protein